MIRHTPRESYLWLKALWDHRQNARMTRAQLEMAQLKKFRRLVLDAQKRSPFYRDLIRDRHIDPLTCVPEDFPVLSKGEVIEHFDDIVTDRRITRQRIADFLSRSADPEELFEGRYHVLHTSGTSGTMGYFVFSHEAWIKGASHGVRVAPLKWRRRIAFIAATRGHFAGVSLMLAGNDGANRLFFDVRAYHVGQPMAEIVEELNRFQPQVLSGYATVLKMLGEAQERGELRISPHQVGNGGEPLLPDVKAYLEQVFKVPVMNGYASSEHLYMALTLPGAAGMHLLEDDLIFELGPDYTCVTNLFNDAMPLIRYRMDDVLVPDNVGHSPYPFTRVKEIVGRQEDALMFLNDFGREDFIHPIVIVELVVQGLIGWQIVLESKTSFRFRARLDTGLAADQCEHTRASIRQKLSAILAEKHMTAVRFDIEEVEALAIDAVTGKFRLVVRGPGYTTAL
ncbi:MAG: phenylacetate--CoA ligase family protein [Verrucomicrobiaceae bacterium]|nr:phenylacetate--CoA ligase family protein [Verrucomicrobiaceae bacterium]